MFTNTKEARAPQLEEQILPLALTFEPDTEIEEFVDWYKSNTAYLEQQLLKTGAILFQGVPIDSVAKFETVTSSLATKFRNYVDGSYPRRQLKGHVYISTEYDQSYNITLHNELSYSVRWPAKLFFGCVIPPGSGGETPLADSREIYRVLHPDLLDEFKRKQVRYVRNLHGGQGMGPSWQETFETQDRKVVEKYCNEIAIQYHWKDNGNLKLVHIRPAVRQHPVTQEWVWFNQADQFHPSHFPQEVYETLMLLADEKEEELPLYACFGDGSPISADVIREITDTIDRVVVLRPWVKGDLVVVDNMLVAHGRKAYKGDRQIVVSMA